MSKTIVLQGGPRNGERVVVDDVPLVFYVAEKPKIDDVLVSSDGPYIRDIRRGRYVNVGARYFEWAGWE